MKPIVILFAAIFALVISGCASTLGTSGIGYVEDVYYNPSAAVKKQNELTEAPSIQKSEAFDKEFQRMAQNYQQKSSTPNQNTDFAEIQKKYANILASDSIQETDTLVYYNEETGYWVNDFQGSEMDRDYAERLVRFHGPFVGIPYWSPLYNEMVYFNNWDWNVYVDGNYAYAFPSYSNPWYYPYSISPRWSFSFGWGWNNYGYYGGYWGGYYNPWNWYDPWYSSYYWDYPYYGGGCHYYGGNWHGGSHHDFYYNKRNYGPRGGYSTLHSYNTRSNTRATESNRSSVGSNRYTNTPRSGYSTNTRQNYQNQGSLKNTGNALPQSRTTRRSYTPTYNQSQNNATPAYNRSATRSSVNNSTGTTKSTPSGSNVTRQRTQTNSSSSQPQSTTTYRSSSNRGSSNSGSGYSPSRSSSSGSSYTPSRSSSSGSSGSSYTPSRSSSSGSSYSPSRSSSSGSSSYGGGGSSRSSSGGSSSGGASRSTRR